MSGATYLVTVVSMLAALLVTGLPRVREKSGKNKIFSRSGNCQGILKKCQEFWPFDQCQGNVREFCHDN